MLAAQDGVAVSFYPVRNAAESPVFFEMDSQEQLRSELEIEDRGWELGAVVHSHTRTRAHPSQTDVRLAFYPDAVYIIVSLAYPNAPDVRGYRIANGEIVEQPLEIVGP